MKTHLLLLLLLPALALAGEATQTDQITVAPGFQVELLKSAGDRDGSWVCMAIDAKGRLYISPQGAVPESGFDKNAKWGGLVRVTLDEKGHIAAWEKVPVPVGDAMGMLWAFDSLYVSGQGPEGRGIYRLRDTDGDDTLDSAPLWKAVPGGNGEHGAHALVLGPDGKSIYIVHGNSTPLIDGIDPNSPYRHYAEDDLLPPVRDPVATFFDKIKSPYGHILRTDENGTKWELLAGGFRNPYDLDFNADGELFTFDSDMEWDVGLPWYRPTRVLHVVPGGEYGFREGSAKWPAYYPDVLPPAVEIGLGCPTGVKFGTRSNFPPKYQRAFFIMDWTFGRILAVQLHPRGASYTASMEEGAKAGTERAEGKPEAADAAPAAAAAPGGTRSVVSQASGVGEGGGAAGIAAAAPSREVGGDGAHPASVARSAPGGSLFHPEGPASGGDVEVFLSGKGLPVTDLEFGPDGAMYFTIGGRGTQAGLYRVSWQPPNPLDGKTADELELAKHLSRNAVLEAEERARMERVVERIERGTAESQRELAKQVESRSLAGVWPFGWEILKDDQWRLIRFEMRTKLESTPLKEWRKRPFVDEAPESAFIGLLALARVGTKDDLAAILQALTKFPLDSLSEALKLDKLRVIEVALARHGRPSPELTAMGLEKLLRQYPAPSFPLNRELCQILVYLAQSAGSSGESQREVITRTLALMDASSEPAEQIWYALCLRLADGWMPAQRERYFAWFAKARGYKGGNSFAKFILRIRDEALERVPAADRPALLAFAEKDPAPAPPAAAPAPPRELVQAWTVADLLPALPEAGKGRNFARGKAMYAAAQCAACHQFGGEGGTIGPDLTAVASRYNRRDLLEAIIDPNKGISEQYAMFHVVQFDGQKEAVGMIVEETNDSLRVLTDPLRGTTETIGKFNAPKRELLPVSPMPPGLLSTLSKDEILDLLAYLESSGNEQAPAFAPAN